MTETGKAKDAGIKGLTEQPAREGMIIPRHFTREGDDPLAPVKFVKRRSVISEPDGTIVFEMDDVEVPEDWSQLATDIVVSKYFRKAGIPGKGGEHSVRQVIHRIVQSIRANGEDQGYFRTSQDADSFQDELTFMLATQRGAFNSPVWFNCGLHQEYGIHGSPGNWHWDDALGKTVMIDDSYKNPQCSACFIQRVDDNLMSIFNLVQKEARVFKYGSGTGTNFSRVRSKYEHLSGGGTSSGVMSFLEVFDKGAGATKSGGTTRRAAKMVCLDVDHPEIIDFIRWKAKEETKAKALIAAGYDSDFDGEAYRTVSGQNANNSVRVTEEFLKAYEEDGDWSTTLRTSGEVHQTYKAREIMGEVAQAAWSCADPGLQFDTTINDWHTCSATGRIWASNPCSEFMFLDDTACNLASLNLMKFRSADGSFDLDAYRSAIRVFATAMEILVDFSSYPTEEISRNSHNYRPLGLGYANLGTLLMVNGMPYDSEEARAYAGALTAVLCGEAYAVSAEIASHMGSFPGYIKNRSSMMRVIGKHKAAATALIDARICPRELHEAARDSWERAESLGELHGYRNAQMTVLAPTGTIGLLMDCDTTGVEPDFSIVKWKKLAGGGFLKIVNQSLKESLHNLGYTDGQIEDALIYIVGTGNLEDAVPLDLARLKTLGFSDDEIQEAAQSVKMSGNMNAYTPHVNPESLLARGMEWEEIKAAQIRVGGMETIEGAPHVKPEHLPVFDCANRCGEDGKRYIPPIAHIKMMAAVQPFISGAISKTINVPEQTTVDEIEDLYVQSWRYGLKSVALYRDGSKGSQPLNSKSADMNSATGAESGQDERTTSDPNQRVWGERKELPRRRTGFTLEAIVAGHKLFLRTGEYENKELGEIFIDMYKEGAAYRSMMNSFAQAISVGLSYGVPLEKYVKMFTFTRFEPYGITDHPNLRSCTSIPDFIFRILGMEYLGKHDFIHIPPKSIDTRSDGMADDAPALNNVPMETSQHMRENALDEHMAEMMGDAPVCDACGHLTVRNGSCYRCLSCGNSMGCS
ncbi:MAG: vitamin B12-dependent ribonucleotide reductase [SAR324 cluster bacterium]|nr:vitamin B12-dependent ribonucleotide reductase [SAR324 cluster bacterium]